MEKNRKKSENRRKNIIRKTTAVILCIFMVLTFAISMADMVHAATNSAYLYDFSGTRIEGTLTYVTDLANLLSDDEERNLSSRAESLTLAYECNTYILTVDDFESYSSSGDIMQFAKDVYTTYDLGYGESKDGTLLVLSMNDRSWTYIAYGDFANEAYTDYAKSLVEDDFLSYFGDDSWYDGFEAYLDGSEMCLSAAADGEPIDSDGSGGITSDPGTMQLIFIVAGIIIGLVVVLIMKSSMKSAVAAAEAREYVAPDTFNVTHSRDIFTHTTETRVRIEKDSGGTSIGSDGFSGDSGRF